MKRSAGILMYKFADGEPLVLLVHPGGPYWAKKDLGSWSIPKGEYQKDEDPETVAIREFFEETGFEPSGRLMPLGEVAQSQQKTVSAWAVEGDFDPSTLKSNLFEMEWPPKSGHIRSFPEVDRAQWFTFPEARQKIIAGQIPFLDRLEGMLPSAHQRLF
jgi:predicted NUDIX family NTP pyrophosphohydrolase